jgi:hypothetical protein
MLTSVVVPGDSTRPGLPETLFRMPPGATWDISPAGDRFLVEQLDRAANGATSTFVVATNWLDELRQRMPPKP